MTIVVTNAGKEAIYNQSLGKDIVLTRAVLGSGNVENTALATGLKTPVVQAEMTPYIVAGDKVQLSIYFDNSTGGGLQTAFKCKEIGIFGTSDGSEKLLYYCYDTEGEYINKYSGNQEIYDFAVCIVCANTQTVRTTSVGRWATSAEVTAIAENKIQQYCCLIRTSDPTESTIGRLGQLCHNTSNDCAFVCVNTSGAYTWTNLGVGLVLEEETTTLHFTATRSAYQFGKKGTATIICVGAGGAGAAGCATSSGLWGSRLWSGGGGGSGYVTSQSDVTIEPKTYYSLTVGDGGSTSANNGGAGGASSFVGGGYNISANGGGGGVYSNTKSVASTGGTGRVNGSNGTYQYYSSGSGSQTGGAGGTGYTYDGATYGAGGRGGDAIYDGSSYSTPNRTAGSIGGIIVVLTYKKIAVEE